MRLLDPVHIQSTRQTKKKTLTVNGQEGVLFYRRLTSLNYMRITDND